VGSGFEPRAAHPCTVVDANVAAHAPNTGVSPYRALMRVDFQASSTSSLGVEIELGLIDIETRELTCIASDVLAEVGSGHPGGEHPRAKHELYESTIEVITGICTTVAQARADLSATVDEIRAVIEPRGAALEGAGLHPFSRWFDLVQTPGERYAELVNRIQWPARRLMTHGVHFHVGVRSAEKAIAFTNALTHYLPHFVALSASSPYWHGHDSGLASVRTKIFEAMPTAGLPPNLNSWADFEHFMATLIRAGSIKTVREVWWDIRPHPDFGTVELRMCDGIPTLTEVASLAALAQSLVDHLDQQYDAGQTLPSPRDWIRRENKWRAARDGIDASIVIDDNGSVQPIRESIDELVTTLMPTAERLQCADELRGLLSIMEHGPSYQRQRAVVTAGGSLSDVVDLLRDEMITDIPGGRR
jgi:carboxylate-amine ligase